MRLLLMGGAWGFFLWSQGVSLDSVTIDTVRLYGERSVFLSGRWIPSLPRPVFSLQEALQSAAGVEWMATGAFSGRAVLRGHSYSRILWLFGSMPREGAYWGEDHGFEAPPAWKYTEVAVHLGPQSVRYGSDALGGVLKVRPQCPDSSLGWGALTLLTNPLGSHLQAAFAHKQKARRVWGELFDRRYHNYCAPGKGYVWNSGLRARYGYAAAQFYSPTSVWTILALGADEEVGLPSTSYDPSTATWTSPSTGQPIPARTAYAFMRDLPFQHIRSAGLSMQRVSAAYLLSLSLQHNVRAEYSSSPITPDVLLRTSRVDWEGLIKVRKSAEVGLTGFWRETHDAGSSPFLPRVHHTEMGVWGRHTHEWGSTTLLVGVRVHGARSRSLQGGPSRTFLTWAMEVAYYRSPIGLRLSRGFRLPQAVELWAHGFHAGAGRYEIGSPLLPSEVAWTLEGDLSPWPAFAIRSFVQYFPAYLFVERLPDTLPTAVGAAFQWGSRQALLYGAELEGQRQGWSLGVGWVQGQWIGSYAREGRFLPRIPPLRIRVAYEAARKAWKPFVELLLYAPQTRVYGLYQTKVPTPGYLLVHAAFRWRRLTVGVQNLLHASYQPHLSSFRQWIPGGIPFPGRSLYLQWEWNR
ncbi:MAG: hypothetical protein KatS3mg026_0802 [Bacteroidia bacterium]|nr:MAG: hypothetical protein KatS3mg026_0802 [Bacteroidia bacterium]